MKQQRRPSCPAAPRRPRGPTLNPFRRLATSALLLLGVRPGAALSVAGVSSSGSAERFLRGAGNASANASAHGPVTDYSLVGCRERYAGVAGLTEKDDPLDMTVQRCFLLCKQRKSVRYFGLQEGRKCWCAPFFYGNKLNEGRCDTPCDGDKGKKKGVCGGVGGATSVYAMFDCTPPTKAEKAAEEQAETGRILGSYTALAKSTCGKKSTNQIAVAGSKTMTGSVTQCKLACWSGTGSLSCHGFTYDADKKRCTFHADVFDGNRTKATGSTCYYKNWPK